MRQSLNLIVLSSPTRLAPKATGYRIEADYALHSDEPNADLPTVMAIRWLLLDIAWSHRTVAILTRPSTIGVFVNCSELGRTVDLRNK
jgi:hypothetical protein